jgi:glycosyltransferase involved in cell wall biosynthesis
MTFSMAIRSQTVLIYGADLRVLGVGKTWSAFFDALARRFQVVDVVEAVDVSGFGRYWNIALSFHPRKERWRAKAQFNPRRALKRTRDVQRALDRHHGRYDLIVQLQTKYGPGFYRAGVPYVVYTDNTMALTQRFYPAWAPLPARAASRWLQLEAEICRSASIVFTFSEFARGSVIADYGCASQRVAAVGAGARLLLDSVNGKDYRAPRALFVGRNFERKGGSVLLDAWSTVQTHLPDAELVIAGPREMQRELPARITWVGPVSDNQLSQLYRSASVFVMPSLFEPWGLVFLEAMGHGLPCIGTSSCAMPEIITDGSTGYLVPPYEAGPLAVRLTELLADPEKAAAMGRLAHARVVDTGTWDHVIDRIAFHLGDTSFEAARPAGA